MEVKVYTPHPALQEFVMNISTIHVVLPEGMEEASSPYPPTPFQSLLFYCNDPVSMSRNLAGEYDKQPLTVLVGPQLSRVNIKVHRQLRAIRVDFFPGAMYRLLGVPMQELSDQGFDARDFLDIRIIIDQLQLISNLEDGKIVVENFLIEQTKYLRPGLPFDAALRQLFLKHGNIPIEEIASLACLSLKQFERKSQERLGMNPKMYARILKFSKAYRLHEASPALTWTQIACDSGYYDHMHMIRDFKAFAGVNPSIIEAQLLSTPIKMQKDLHR
jgi:AraC-like DNA-binding protein